MAAQGPQVTLGGATRGDVVKVKGLAKIRYGLGHSHAVGLLLLDRLGERLDGLFGPGALLRGRGLGGLGRPNGYGQVLSKGPGPSGCLGKLLRSLSKLTPKGLSLAHRLGSLAPRLVPLADDLAKLQLPLLHLRLCQRRLCLHRRYL